MVRTLHRSCRRAPRRSRTRPLAALATLAAVAVVLAASPVGPPEHRSEPALRIEADCRIVEALRLEPLGDEAEESAFASQARCLASTGPLAGASAQVDLVWAFDRGRIDRDAIRWHAADGALTTPGGSSIVRREADGRWRTDLQGTVGDASGRVAALAGRRYVLVARLDASSLAPAAPLDDDADR